tara:strand:- start:903 stop:1121 length:219 start_codon:yes stop_codon:yes gene_type:complete
MLMDVVDFSRYLYKVLRARESDIAFAMSQGSVKTWEDYKMLVGEIRGLSLAQEEIKTLLESNQDDVEDIISS